MNQTVELEAKALKKASAASVVWSVKGIDSLGFNYAVDPSRYTLTPFTAAYVFAEYNADTLEYDQYWVSKNSFVGLAAGTYEITAVMTMTAGKSDVTFVGSDSVQVEVVNPVVVTGFVSKTKYATEIWNKKHTSIIGYDVTYDLYIQYSDGSTSLYQADLVQGFGGGQQTDRSVKINYDGIDYAYVIYR